MSKYTVTLTSEQFSLLCAAVTGTQAIIDNTYAYDEETGERLDESGKHSAADIVEQLCNLEGVIGEAVEMLDGLAIQPTDSLPAKEST